MRNLLFFLFVLVFVPTAAMAAPSSAPPGVITTARALPPVSAERVAFDVSLAPAAFSVEPGGALSLEVPAATTAENAYLSPRAGAKALPLERTQSVAVTDHATIYPLAVPGSGLCGHGAAPLDVRCRDVIAMRPSGARGGVVWVTV